MAAKFAKHTDSAARARLEREARRLGIENARIEQRVKDGGVSTYYLYTDYVTGVKLGVTRPEASAALKKFVADSVKTPARKKAS